MPKDTLFWNLAANRYAKSPVGNEDVYQEKLRRTRELMGPEMEVLEFGCGTGSTAIAHAPFVKHIQAIDFSSKMIAICQAKADDAGVKNVTFKQSSIDDWNIPDGSYDIVMGHSILHLLRNWQAVIARVYSVLKPGGVFVSSTTCIGGSSRALRVLMPIGAALGVLPPLQFLTVAELAAAFTAAGFEIDQQWQPDGSDAVFIVAKKPA